MKKHRRFVLMEVQRWDRVTALTPAPQKIAPMGKSIGFLLVYHSLAALREDYPDTDYIEVEPK